MFFWGLLSFQLSVACPLGDPLTHALVALQKDWSPKVIEYLAMPHTGHQEDVLIKARAMQAYLDHPDLEPHAVATLVDVSEKLPVLQIMEGELRIRELEVVEIINDLTSELATPLAQQSWTQRRGIAWDLLSANSGLDRIRDMRLELKVHLKNRRLNLFELTTYADDYPQLIQTGLPRYTREDPNKVFERFPQKISLPSFSKLDPEEIEDGVLSGADFQGMAKLDETYSYDGTTGLGRDISIGYSWHDRAANRRSGHFYLTGLTTPPRGNRSAANHIKDYVDDLNRFAGFIRELTRRASHLSSFSAMRYIILHEVKLDMLPRKVLEIADSYDFPDRTERILINMQRPPIPWRDIKEDQKSLVKIIKTLLADLHF